LIDLSNIRRTLLIAYIVGLLAVTLAPVPGSVYPPSGFDKLVHVGLFGGLAFLIMWNLNSWRRITVVEALSLTVVAAILIEVLQGMLPFRNADTWDLLAGTVGALLGVGLAGAARKLKHSRDSVATGEPEGLD
jgi:VanZ family protein